MRQTKLEEFLNLEEQNKELEEKFQEQLKKAKEKDRILFHQNKLASLGEMLGNISHQWRQPLMEVSSLFLPIEAKLNLGKNIDEKELSDTIKKLHDINKYMSETINDFTDFFALDKKKVQFKLIDQINSTINIINGSLNTHNIKLDIYIKKNPTLYGYKNEYSQVLINILANARDVLIQKKIENPYIKIEVFEEDNNIITTIEDNGMGIKVKPIEKIFEPFYSSKKNNGTGIGLFMSKLIIVNNMNGLLTVQNTQKGAFFKISIPKI